MVNFYQKLNRDKKGPEADLVDVFEHHKKEGEGEKNKENNISEEAVPQKPNFLQYQDTTGQLSGSKLKKFLWLTKNKLLFYRLTVSFLIIFIAVSFGFSFWQFGDYLIFGIQEDQELYSDLASSIDYTGIHTRYNAQSLQILSTKTFNSNTNKFDVVSQIYNPNDRFFAEIQYHFSFFNTTTPAEIGFLLPLETGLLVKLGLDDSKYNGSYSLVIEDVKWQRISNLDIKDLDGWMEERLNFDVSDVNFVSKTEDGSLSGSVLNFDLVNNSPFSYRTPEFLVGLYQSGYLSGVLPLQTDNFYSGETKNIDLRIFVSNVFDEIELFPVINLFDDESYLDPTAS